MKYSDYNEIADKFIPKKHIIKDSIISFIIGGIMGLIGEGLIELFIYYFNFSRDISTILMLITIIFITCLLTGIGIFDKFVSFSLCGLIIPISGFAHSVSSVFLDYRKEGLVYGIGSNAFKLAGSVIVYGVLSAWLFGSIRFFIGG